MNALRARRWWLLGPLAAVGAAALAVPAVAGATTVRDGDVRFQFISPTLVRLEHAPGGSFEGRPTLNVPARRFAAVPVTRRVRGGVLELRTTHVVVRYRRGSGAFDGTNLEVRLRLDRRRTVVARPRFGPAPGPPAGPPSLETSPYTVAEDPGYRPPARGNLGGWYRALDLADEPVRLHDGLLTREGWYLLDDTRTALLTSAPPGFAQRSPRAGYQDGYLFAYGRDYARGLADLRRLTGAAPLLPRGAFGVWFSKYFAFRQADYGPLLARFRQERVPLDVLMVDTDFKAPHAWNGWNWSEDHFPDPDGFLAAMRAAGVYVSLNVHPSITTDDPRFADARRRAGGALGADPTTRCRAFITIGDAYGGRTPPALPPGCHVFDWTRAGDQDAYFALHAPFERPGMDFWWLDYCCDESHAVAPGLTQDAWINHLYARRNFARGSRWPVLSRVGASVFDPDEAGTGIWAEHRNAIHFTGDARPSWRMLDFQTTFTASEGNVGIPYVSHDIGGFGSITSDGLAGRHLADDLYVRWVQSGTFQPILRLHSDHGDRLPWEYPGRAQEIATRFLRLRGELVPLLYTLAREAHDRGLPLARHMYLQWPGLEAAYRHPSQYMLGRDLLVAPVGTPGDGATKDVWLPPGTWTDFFTGRRHRGGRVVRFSVPLERMPVLVREGAVLPLQGYQTGGNRRPPGRLVVQAWPGARGSFTLYEDEGDGLGHRRGRFARTRLAQRRAGGTTTVSIGPARGEYPGRPRARRWSLRVVGVARPRAATLDGRPVRVRYDAATRTAVVDTPRVSTARTVRLVLRG